MTRTPEEKDREIVSEALFLQLEEERKRKAETTTKTNAGIRNANAERRKADAASLADKYISRDGGKPDLEALSKLEPLEYGQVRKEVADRIGTAVKFLDDEVKERKRPVARAARAHWEVEPAEKALAPHELLIEIKHRLQRHVVMDSEQALTVALWTMFAWMHDAAVHSPILLVSSPEAECGKTTLLGLVSLLVPRGLMITDASAAVVYRMIAAWNPTLIVDEADQTFRDNPELRQIINSGWTRGAGVPRCHPETHDPEFFETFGPKAIGLKGLNVPDTTLGRSIVIELSRKLPTDRVGDFDHTDDPGLAKLRAQIARWARDNKECIRTTVPRMPDGFFNRVRANWKLIMAIAEHCGYGVQAREAAVKLSRRSDEASLGVELLRDIRETFERLRLDRITSEQLVNELGNCPDRPWCEMDRTGKPITQLQLARMLKGFGVRPRKVRFDALTFQGYMLEWFEKAFRYIPTGETPESSRNTGTTAESSQKGRNKTRADVPAKMAENGQCSTVPGCWAKLGDDPFLSPKDPSRKLPKGGE
jgi:hypothetical protein